jgi:hypothetical protein
MIRQTLSGEQQARDLFEGFLRKERYDAYRRLAAAIAEAVARIEADPMTGAPFPRPYPAMARWNFRWIKVHRYWFSWSTRKGYPVITNILYDQSQIDRRVAPDDDLDVEI